LQAIVIVQEKCNQTVNGTDAKKGVKFMLLLRVSENQTVKLKVVNILFFLVTVWFDKIK
jgi:hypothetical protein